MQVKESGIGTEPLLLADVKNYLRVDYADDDAYLTDLITSVRQKVEEYTGRALVVKTIEVWYDDIPNEIKLPFPEHDKIVEVKFNGVVSTAYYKTGLTQFVIEPYYIPTATYTNERGTYVKYTTTGNFPSGIKDEMLKIISDMYVNRGNTENGMAAFDNLSQFSLI